MNSSQLRHNGKNSTLPALIEMAQVDNLRWFKTRQIPYIIISLPGVFAIYVFSVNLLRFGAGQIWDVEALIANPGRANAWQISLGLIGGFLPIFIAVGLWVRIFEGRRFMTIGLISRKPGVEYVRGLVCGFAMLGAVVLIMASSGIVVIQNPFNQVALGSAMLIAVGWVVQGAAEEFLTRGFITQIVGRRFGVVAAVILSAFVFSILHGANSNVTLLALVNLALVAIYLSLYSLQEGSLWGVCAWHSAWNWAQGNLFGFEVSGGDLALEVIVFDLAENGPDWITGGPFGLEGGVITSAVLLIGIIWLLNSQAGRFN